MDVISFWLMCALFLGMFVLFAHSNFGWNGAIRGWRRSLDREDKMIDERRFIYDLLSPSQKHALYVWKRERGDFDNLPLIDDERTQP